MLALLTAVITTTLGNFCRLAKLFVKHFFFRVGSGFCYTAIKIDTERMIYRNGRLFIVWAWFFEQFF